MQGDDEETSLIAARAKSLGVTVNTLLLDHGRPHWVGSFSNLGRWDPPTTGETPWAWVFFPPPVASQPLGIGCVTYRGRLGIALQIHSSLTTDASMAEEWLVDMGRELVGASWTSSA